MSAFISRRNFVFYVLFLSASLLSNRAYGQVEIRYGGTQYPPMQDWAFMKYGNNADVNHFTGTINFEIPIYTLEDDDFNMPITLRYSSNGYEANQASGDLGLGWIIDGGGVITREVRGCADENPSSRFYNEKGFYWYSQEAKGSYPSPSDLVSKMKDKTAKMDISTPMAAHLMKLLRTYTVLNFPATAGPLFLQVMVE